MKVTEVKYQGVRNVREDLEAQVPAEAKIALFYFISKTGQINVFAKNLTDQIMTVDRVKSFYVNFKGQSSPFYNPNVYTTSTATTNSSSTTGSFGIGLGAVSSVLGIGGAAGTLMGSSTLGVSSSVGTAVTNSSSTVFIDQKEVSIAPYAEMQIASVEGAVFGSTFLKYYDGPNFQDKKGVNVSVSFTVSYSFEDGNSDRLTTIIKTCEILTEIVQKHGRGNEALRKIISTRSIQPHWCIYNLAVKKTDAHYKDPDFSKNDAISLGFIYDYK